MLDLGRLQLCVAELTPTQARILARLPLAGADDERLEGTIVGPRSIYSHTLPAKFPLRPIAAAGELLAEAILPEPCYWMPAAPLLYDVQIFVNRGGRIVAQERRLLGLRPLVARGLRLRLADHNWVPRGVHNRSIVTAELAEWHNLDTVLIDPSPPDDLCRQASEIGVLLMAELSGANDHIRRELLRLSRWPAVGLAVVESPERLEPQIRASAPNMLLVSRLVTNATAPPAWANALLIDAHDQESLIRIAGQTSAPVLAERRLPTTASLAAARAACDTLQRDLAQGLASQGIEIAGYVV
jgi:hypothetical protein